MGVFGTNMIFAIIWVAITGTATLSGLLVGFVVGFAALWLIQPLTGATQYFRRFFAWIKLIVMFHYELFLSSVSVLKDILTPQHLARPAIIEVPLDVKSDAGILLVTFLLQRLRVGSLAPIDSWWIRADLVDCLDFPRLGIQSS